MTTPPLLLHIGYHKTATKWLQTKVFPATAEQGFSRIEGARPAGWDLVRSDGLDFDATASRRAFAPHVEAAREAAPCTVPVLSWERLSGSPHSGGYDAGPVADRLAAVFPQARVFVVVREQAAMLLSCYNQYVRAGGTSSLREYALREPDAVAPVFRMAFLEYDRLIAYYQGLFGPDNVLALPYELFVHAPDAFLDRLEAFAGATRDGPRPGASAKVNASSDGLTISLKRRLNLFIHRESLNGWSPLRIPGAWRVEEKVFAGLDGLLPQALHRKLRLRRAHLAQDLCRGQFTDSNRRLSNLMGLDLGAFGYEVSP